MAAVDGTGAYTDLAALGQLRREARTQDPETVREAARQFESLFTRMLLKSMREASLGDGLFESDQGLHRDMLDDQLAVELSRGKGLGLAEMLIQQLQRAGLVSSDSASAVEAWPVQAAPSSQAAPPEDSAWRSGSPARFVREMWPHAERAARELGVDARAVLAQAALETGWGRAVPCGPDGRCSFNLFGMKAAGGWTGAAVAAPTLEYEHDAPAQQIERFRAYDSPAESFADYVRLLKGSARYAGALAAGGDVRAFATGLVRGGYATDPDYAEKLAAVAGTVEALAAAELKSGSGRPIQPAATG